jgi:hypothetical protein
MEQKKKTPVKPFVGFAQERGYTPHSLYDDTYYHTSQKL